MVRKSCAYLLPFEPDGQRILEIELRCERAFQPSDPEDRRELGLMIFQVGLGDRLPAE